MVVKFFEVLELLLVLLILLSHGLIRALTAEEMKN
jgi:hypothetical protein